MAYTNTLITIAADCPISTSEVPNSNRPKKPIHQFQYELLLDQPYTLTHKDLTFVTYLRKQGIENISEQERQEIWDDLFSKGHPCLRASALTKRYGFGAHYNEEGKIAIYPIESEEYQQLVADANIKKVPAMKSKR